MLQQVTVAGFIDIITLGKSFVEYERNIRFIETLLDSQGLGLT